MFTRFSKLRRFNPKTIMTDFEQAMNNAFVCVFPNASHSNCFYHFSQCIYRRLQHHRLQNDYSDEDFSLFIRMLAAVTLVSVTYAVDAYDTLVDAGYPDRAEPVVNYFEDNFIGRLDRRGNRRNPVFPLSLWNVHVRVVES